MTVVWVKLVVIRGSVHRGRGPVAARGWLYHWDNVLWGIIGRLNQRLSVTDGSGGVEVGVGYIGVGNNLGHLVRVCRGYRHPVPKYSLQVANFSTRPVPNVAYAGMDLIA